ncbi:hypothetical protein IQ218_15125 [Synechocystis salina LEGE 06099]|uniref:hypothetical protein n=1 Tax=Synechocystis salina TaxID=945780 RepID=UPI001882A2F2|nr:hypothetical protein [Synechocystis salina]MBE9204530.1 hypothetical protein [Synechocystis salina LEGE 06099]
MATGLPQSKEQRFHFDIYAILETAQELYLGHEVQVNVNMVEVIKLQTRDGKSLDKCYISPTKRRGVERRCLIWAPHGNGQLLGDKLDCGIPKTCAAIECPICSVFGGLEAGKKTLIGRVSHGGGVAIQAIDPEEKQRAMHPSRMASPKSGKDETPIPFKRQYNQPGILYPISNHCLSITDQDFAAVAYAFLDSLPRIGSSNPKGVSIAENLETKEPLLVLDRYLVPKGKRPVISPSVTNPTVAVEDFIRLTQIKDHEGEEHVQLTHFERWNGDAALDRLQDYSSQFVNTVLNI